MWACASTSPGITVAPRRSTTRVPRPRHFRTSDARPSAAMRPPPTAIASADGRRGSSVWIRALTRTVSAAASATARRGPVERRRHLVQQPRELPALVPGGEPERHVAHPGVEVGGELGGALLRGTRDGPALHEGRAELRAVVRVQERLGLLEPGLAILADVDVVVERAAHLRGVAALLA